MDEPGDPHDLDHDRLGRGIVHLRLVDPAQGLEREFEPGHEPQRSFVVVGGRQVFERLPVPGQLARDRRPQRLAAEIAPADAIGHLEARVGEPIEHGPEIGTQVFIAHRRDVVERELIPAREDLTQALNVPAGEELASIVRLRLADGEPMTRVGGSPS